MERVSLTRRAFSLLLALATAVSLATAGGALAAEPEQSAAPTVAAAPAEVASVVGAPPAEVAPSGAVAPAAQAPAGGAAPEPPAMVTAVTVTTPTPASPGAGVAPNAADAAPPAEAQRPPGVEPSAPAPALAAVPVDEERPSTYPPLAPAEAEAHPEGTETAPVLVGPDDDKLLEEVEKHVNISPAGPAIKIAEPTYDIPLELNAKVLDYVEIFQTTRRRSFEAGLTRSRKYEALMKPVFAELGVPTDLYYLALIESGYNPKAYSYAKAMGIWQFISSTGRLYGLRRTEYLDERRDPMKSTRAAARHLKDLYDELGSWPLALAAYNAGKGRVQRAIAKAGTTDFWSLELPAQTRNYVPAFFAAVIIAKDPERYGFQPEFESLVATDSLEVPGSTRLSLVAALCHTSVDAIQDLNPELRKSVVPPGGPYALRVPAGRLEELTAGLAKVPTGKAAGGMGSYRVQQGDTLFAIAQRFGTSAEALRDANRLAGSDIRVGQQLSIPGQRIAAAPIPRAPGRITVSSSVPATHVVQPGDNPWSVAKRYNVALDDLLAWNGLDSDSVLSIGQALALRETAAGDAPRTARGGRTYEVRKGDNLWQISRRFDTSVEELRRLNGFGAGHDLKPGDRVVLP